RPGPSRVRAASFTLMAKPPDRWRKHHRTAALPIRDGEATRSEAQTSQNRGATDPGWRSHQIGGANITEPRGYRSGMAKPPDRRRKHHRTAALPIWDGEATRSVAQTSM